ncbi:hypothetical protein [Gaoshiqia sp. Z1-71]|uniref:hypothetical protein n=1 Tax=Gaoshiqia hydrogeniformans TaxID=3290090 RepID=UPI003BF7CE20
MKKISLIVLVFTVLSACQYTAKKQIVIEEVFLMTVDQVQESGSAYVGKTVAVTGIVSHVCQHGGGRCFLMGSTEDVTLRVEAGGSVNSFTQEQMGSKLVVTGILDEIRIDEDYLQKQEADILAKQAENGDHVLGHDGGGNHEIDGGKHESDQMQKIADLREQVEQSKKGYLSVFFLRAESMEEAGE